MFFLMLSQLSQLFRPHQVVINFTMLIPQVQDKYMIVNQLFVFFTTLKKLMFCITGIVRLKNKEVFGLIQKHSLYTAVSDKIQALMELDWEQATRMLLDNIDKIPVC